MRYRKILGEQMPSNDGPSELTQVAREGLIDTLLGAAEYGFAESFYAATDYPGFVADNSPTAPHLAFGKAVTRQACRRWARGGGPGSLPGFNAAWGGICGPYLDGLGENPGPGSLALPFVGGQCVGVGYFGNYEYNSVGTNGQILEPPIRQGFPAGPQGIPGPIRGIEKRAEGAGVSLYLLVGGGEILLRQSSAPQGDFENPRIVNVFRADGMPDNCGDPPPIYDPPRVPVGLPGIGPVTINLPGVGPVAIDVDFDPEGNINVDLPEVGIDFTVEDPFGFGDNSEGEQGGDGGPPPGDVGEPGGFAEPGPGGDAEGVAPEGSVLVGLRVQILEAPESRARYTDTVLRGAYYVYMGVPGLLDHDPAGAMATSDQFIFSEKDNLTAWRVSANNGYSLRVTPYYRQVGE